RRPRGRHDGATRPDPRPDPGQAGAAAAGRDSRKSRVHGPQGARARPGTGGKRARVGRAAPVTAVRALATRVRARRWPVAAAALAVFAVYQALILGVLVAGLGGAPNYLRLYPAWDNARRIVRLTPSAADAATLIAREPLVEYGRRHPTFGVAVWSYELTWSSLAFFLSFSALVGLYLGIGGLPAPLPGPRPPLRRAGVGPLAAP